LLDPQIKHKKVQVCGGTLGIKRKSFSKNSNKMMHQLVRLLIDLWKNTIIVKL